MSAPWSGACCCSSIARLSPTASWRSRAWYNAFGFRDLMELLESGALSIICDYMSMGNIGQTRNLKITRRRGGTLPLCSYRIVPGLDS